MAGGCRGLIAALLQAAVQECEFISGNRAPTREKWLDPERGVLYTPELEITTPGHMPR
jgi:hypothetical protein